MEGEREGDRKGKEWKGSERIYLDSYILSILNFICNYLFKEIYGLIKCY